MPRPRNLLAIAALSLLPLSLATSQAEAQTITGCYDTIYGGISPGPGLVYGSGGLFAQAMLLLMEAQKTNPKMTVAEMTTLIRENDRKIFVQGYSYPASPCPKDAFSPGPKPTGIYPKPTTKQWACDSVGL